MPASLSVFREFKHLETRRVSTGLNIVEFERWMRLKLELDAMRSGVPDRRRCFRMPTRLLCSLSHNEMTQRSVISNFSHGGAFVQTRAPLPADARLQLTLDTADGPPLRVDAVVVSVQIDPAVHPDEHGMGIRFIGLDAADAARIAKLYGELCRDEPRDECAATG